MFARLLICYLFISAAGCGGDSSTGSKTFVAAELVVSGNPSILGEPAGTLENPSGYLSVGGLIDSQLGIELTGLSAQIRVLSADLTVLGQVLAACSPPVILPGASATFQPRLVLPSAPYTASRIVEITPICDQGTGTARNVTVQWNEP